MNNSLIWIIGTLSAPPALDTTWIRPTSTDTHGKLGLDDHPVKSCNLS
jgi:hypothetical protein